MRVNRCCRCCLMLAVFGFALLALALLVGVPALLEAINHLVTPV